ncbi:polysaccharide biosynthesis C-terminal domain-containing protein [Clostridium saudiense]|uniref:lipid II flippase MurJ n=1 Tax=Clostridium saudiense TaxID=1414720 RepID=UPI00082237BE|nr:polysaccharide biosynthesis C-terminal domain-containing protein [Clostridium saudiense]MDU7453387.1 polysaccharide biosynthesis C-terminal domain-containing protein [Clostridium saudiense]SCJ84108.1 integral membrane protein MviN [uncultured Clostridium sp.]
MGFVKNSLYTLISNIIIICIGFFTSWVISRTLGAELQGVYNLAILIPNLMYNFLNFGQDTSTMFFLSNKTINKSDLIDNMIPVSIFYTIISTLLGTLFIFLLKDSMFTEVSNNTLIFALIISPLTFLNNNLTAVLKSEGEFFSVNKVQVINKIIYFLICTILFFIVDVNIVIFANIIILSISIISLWKKIGIKSIRIKFNKEYQKKNISYGFKSYLANMITFLNYRLDTFIIKALSKSTMAVGQYGVSVTLAEQVWVFASAISSVMFPYITSIENDEDKSKVTSLTFKIVMVVTFMAIIVLFFASNLIRFVYGEDYYGSIIPLKILLIGVFSLSLGKILANDIASRGKPELNALSNLMGLLVNVIFNILLIPRFGIAGAAMATSISYTLTSSIFLISFIKLTGLTLKELLVFNKEERVVITIFIKEVLSKHK